MYICENGYKWKKGIRLALRLTLAKWPFDEPGNDSGFVVYWHLSPAAFDGNGREVPILCS